MDDDSSAIRIIDLFFHQIDIFVHELIPTNVYGTFFMDPNSIELRNGDATNGAVFQKLIICSFS